MPQYNFDIRFKTRVEKTPRVLEVAEGFGIGLADSEFVIYDNLKLTVKDGDVIYITGQSGSGKSLLLKALAAELEKRVFVSRLDEIELKDVPIIDQIGSTTAEALKLLARAGISDAFLFVRKPSELSDGQRYRVKLAKLLESGAQVWVADEFGAVLDRETAKVIAFNMSRAARDVGATLIVATTHTDLKSELAPTTTVTKHYRERLKVESDHDTE
ncbi:MAG: ATP-binding cassette domain-containing protein [Rhodobacterales bacterium]|nr:ATP-binding cassette domain-containing protein [Rhodobacterales bacterium]